MKHAIHWLIYAYLQLYDRRLADWDRRVEAEGMLQTEQLQSGKSLAIVKRLRKERDEAKATTEQLRREVSSLRARLETYNSIANDSDQKNQQLPEQPRPCQPLGAHPPSSPPQERFQCWKSRVT